MSERSADDSDGFTSDWARAHLPSYGPDWDRAIEFGVDVTLLLENLARSPAERLQRLQQAVEFHALLRSARAMSRPKDKLTEVELRAIANAKDADKP